MDEGVNQVFLCPILQTVMTDPVMAQDGHTYEYSAIVGWFKKNSTSPVTRANIATDQLFPNFALRTLLEAAGHPCVPPMSTVERIQFGACLAADPMDEDYDERWVSHHLLHFTAWCSPLETRSDILVRLDEKVHNSLNASFATITFWIDPHPDLLPYWLKIKLALLALIKANPSDDKLVIRVPGSSERLDINEKVDHKEFVGRVTKFLDELPFTEDAIIPEGHGGEGDEKNCIYGFHENMNILLTARYHVIEDHLHEDDYFETTCCINCSSKPEPDDAHSQCLGNVGVTVHDPEMVCDTMIHLYKHFHNTIAIVDNYIDMCEVDNIDGRRHPFASRADRCYGETYSRVVFLRDEGLYMFYSVPPRTTKTGHMISEAWVNSDWIREDDEYMLNESETFQLADLHPIPSDIWLFERGRYAMGKACRFAIEEGSIADKRKVLDEAKAQIELFLARSINKSKLEKMLSDYDRLYEYVRDEEMFTKHGRTLFKNLVDGHWGQIDFGVAFPTLACYS